MSKEAVGIEIKRAVAINAEILTSIIASFQCFFLYERLLKKGKDIDILRGIVEEVDQIIF
jgi:hypothetical protein